MIRKENCKDVTDEEFEKLVLPHNDMIDKYLAEISYEYVAFYLATGYDLSALWEGTLKTHVNSALQVFCDSQNILDQFDYEKLKKILRDKYNLEIISTDTCEMIRTKK